jgi:hypothetical protein
MTQRRILSLVLVVLFLLPFAPFPPAGSSSRLIAEPGNSDTLSSSSTSLGQPVSQGVPTSSSRADKPASVEVPAPPDSQQFTGSPRAVVLEWNRTRVFNNRDQSADFGISGEVGMLYHEINNFTQIKTAKVKIIVENYDFWDPLAPYLSSPDVNQPIFIGFQIPPERVAVDGFWFFQWGGSSGSGTTAGLVNYTIFPAKPGIAPALAMPNLTAPVRWPAFQALIPAVAKNNGTWVWLNTDESSLFLDNASTYANTYFFAVWRPLTGSPKIQPVLCSDDTWPDGPGADESDSYIAAGKNDWTLVYYRYDFFLNVSIIRYPYPSNVVMRVNSSPVRDISRQPGKGVWENWVSPAFNMSRMVRLYDVTSTAPMLFFDVIWSASLYSSIAANTMCTVWTDRNTTDWEIQFDAGFPSGALGRIMRVSIERDWNVTEVRCNGVPFYSWTRLDSQTAGSWIIVDNPGNGSWLVRCEGPDYVASAQIKDQYGSNVTSVYAADSVYVYGYVHSPFGVNATNGHGYLLVYAPDDSSHYSQATTLSPPPDGVIALSWPVWATVRTLGLYSLQLAWTNGTEAGVVATSLEVVVSPTTLKTLEETPSPGEDVIRGQNLEFLFYYCDYVSHPLDRAAVTVTNNTDPLKGVWLGSKSINYKDEGYPGYYRVFVPTDNATLEFLHDITVNFVQDCYEPQNHSRVFTIVSSSAHIVLLQGQGLDNTTGVWRTTPEPLINESITEFTFKLVTSAGLPIGGATIQANLVKGSGGNERVRRLDWEELTGGGGVTGPTGRYNVTVDLRPIEGETFHEGEEASIIIYAFHPRYETAVSEPIYVRPQPRPSKIDVPEEYRRIDLFENWSYPTTYHPVILRIILRDALTDDDLSHGTVWVEIPGLGVTNLTLATPGLGLYEIPSLSTYGLSAGTYNVTIWATARDFIQTSTTVALVVHAKQVIAYSVNPRFPATTPNQGMDWSLEILFQFGGSTAKMANFVAGQRGTPIPEGTRVELEVITAGGSISMPPAYVGIDGTVTFHGTLAQEGVYSFYITIAGTENYTGLYHVQLEANGSAISVNCVSVVSYFRSILPSFAFFAALIILVPLGAFLGYRHAVLLPRRQRRLAKYQAIADTFSDVVNLNRLLVLHKESGICVFDPFAEETKDATLVAGFLQAISTFGHDLVESPGLGGKDKERASALRELTYEGFRILIHDGQFVRNALVLSGKPSDQLRDRLERFTGEFEKRYRKDFDHWSGRVDQFNSASDLVEEIFLVSLRLPHRVQARRPRGVTLSQLEDDLYKLAKELTKDREYLFLGQILSTYLVTAKRDKLEVLMAIYQLRSKGLLVPWQLGTTLTAASEDAENGAE